MTDEEMAKALVEELTLPEGSTEMRPVHTNGVGAKGYFEPEPIARTYCKAKYFLDQRTDVTVRFSNAAGEVERHDGWSDVRGMATRFHMSDDKQSDLIAMTLPQFFTPTPETFLDFAKAAKPAPCFPQTPWQKIGAYLRLQLPMPDPYPDQKKRPNEGAIRYANENAFSQNAVLTAATIGAPVSYVRASYHAVHTFIVHAPDGTERWVRFNWQPVQGVLNTDPTKNPEWVYLNDELKDRLSEHSPRFTLMMTIGEGGDAFDDPTQAWPPHRTRILMGTLTVTDYIGEDVEKLSFNPCNTPEGISISDDPVLKIRRFAYEFSSKRRDGVACPFAKGQDNG